MTLKLHNTLTRKDEIFRPADENRVTLYTCGPTVYDYPHVGNWSSFIYWDILVRTLIANGYQVERVMNITDVGHLTSDADEGEDKLEKGARRENKTAWEIAEFYAEDFLDGMEKLGMLKPEHVVRATHFIPQQLELVRVLKEKGFTYQTNDGIYFDTSKFPAYANFAKLDLDAQKAGARVEQNDQKRQPWDFALWKFTPDSEKRDMEWETPSDLLDFSEEEADRPTGPAGSDLRGGETGNDGSGESLALVNESPKMGFPGWHLECSAMAMSILGPTIDIHTGGIDHIPVHHTNEIAQSQAASGQQFANYWLHNNHLKIDGTKISKSIGNTYTLQQLDEKGYLPLDLRMLMLQGHYTNEGNFTFENLTAAKNRLHNWRAYAALRHQATGNGHVLAEHKQSILDALNDNLNTPAALTAIDAAFAKLDMMPITTMQNEDITIFAEQTDELLGLQLLPSTPDISDSAKQLIIEREHARNNKDWQKSDSLRSQLESQGIAIRDTPDGTIWNYL